MEDVEIKQIIQKIIEQWRNLQKDFYICYSVKELAYKVVFDIDNAYHNGNCDYDIVVYYRYYNGKHKVIYEIEEGIFFGFDIWWTTTMYGDCGLHIGNAKVTRKIPKLYEDIEIAIEESEDEE